MAKRFPIKVIKNFLSKEQHLFIKNKFNELPWFFNSENYKTKPDNNFMFNHSFLYDGESTSNYYDALILPIVLKLKSIVKFENLLRVKGNMYTNQNKFVEHVSHRDIENTSSNYIIGVYHINTCNGYTKVGSKKITSLENQMILFDNKEKHCGSVQTDTQRRMLINFIIQ
tara:strand:+ start:683 stop:1192 length:510 start_codon:yes stop_codon:yes gene_type:complete